AHVRDVCRIFVFRVAVITRRPAVDPGMAAFDPGAIGGPLASGKSDGHSDVGLAEEAAELPTFANWGQDATAVADRYGEQDTAAIARELAAAVEGVAGAFASVPPAERGLRARRGDGSTFTVESLARYFLHDLVHHVHDVRG